MGDVLLPVFNSKVGPSTLHNKKTIKPSSFRNENPVFHNCLENQPFQFLKFHLSMLQAKKKIHQNIGERVKPNVGLNWIFPSPNNYISTKQKNST